MPSPSQRFSLNAQWLIRLRWVAIFGQVLTIAGVSLLLQIYIETMWALIVVISVTAVSNLFLQFWQKNRITSPAQRDLILGLVMVMDMLSLTALLYATGGANNPFFLFFFVNLSLCAFLLNRDWAWLLNILSILCFMWLLYDHHELDQLNLGVDMAPIRIRGTPSLVQLGLLAAFSTCASVIAYFMIRLTSELRKQQQEVRKAQALQARSEKLEALGTLAAGTAHELATPLSTIAVVARDVEKAFDEHPPEFPGAEDVIEDVHLIRSQLDRCRAIIDRMASQAGQAVGESIQTVPVSVLIDAILDDMPHRNRVNLDVPTDLNHATLKIPVVGLSQALRGLVQNAIDADVTGRPVSIEGQLLEEDSAQMQLTISDRGPGMSEEILKRVSEPFFTTKAPGKGMGLGVYLATNVVERLGGRIRIDSEPSVGTQVTIWLPITG